MASKLLILLLQTFHLFTEVCTVAASALSLSASLGFICVVLCLLSVQRKASISVNASEMLVEIFLSRETLPGMALAIRVWAIQLLSGTAMLVMNLSFVSQETARVGEARQLLAAVCRTLVWSVMLVHVLAAKL